MFIIVEQPKKTSAKGATRAKPVFFGAKPEKLPQNCHKISGALLNPVPSVPGKKSIFIQGFDNKSRCVLHGRGDVCAQGANGG